MEAHAIQTAIIIINRNYSSLGGSLCGPSSLDRDDFVTRGRGRRGETKDKKSYARNFLRTAGPRTFVVCGTWADKEVRLQSSLEFPIPPLVLSHDLIT